MLRSRVPGTPLPVLLVVVVLTIFAILPSVAVSPDELVAAVVADDVPRLRRLLAEGADVDARWKEGFTALHIAAMRGHADITRVLLDAHASVDVTATSSDFRGMTPVSLAISFQHADVLRLLLEAGADPNHQGENGETPLHLASGLGFTEMVRMLLEAGADPNARADYGHELASTPLHVAATLGRVDVVRLLLGAKADVDAGDSKGLTALHYAVLLGWPEIARLLVEAHADVDAVATEPSIVGFTPLHVAAISTRASLVRAAAGASGAPEEDTLEAARILVRNHANVNARTKTGTTPLHLAALYGRAAFAGLLLDAGADVNATDEDGKTPLALAEEEGHEEVAKILRANGARK